jgi:hypothetical protein
MTNTEAPLIGGKSLEEWDRGWNTVEHGLTRLQSDLRDKAGLYRIRHNGRIMALGVGTDKGGGLRKRLSDFRRPSPSGRGHHAGALIHEHLTELTVQVLITGTGREAREVAKQLKRPMLLRHPARWSDPAQPYLIGGKAR